MKCHNYFSDVGAEDGNDNNSGTPRDYSRKKISSKGVLIGFYVYFCDLNSYMVFTKKNYSEGVSFRPFSLHLSKYRKKIEVLALFDY